MHRMRNDTRIKHMRHETLQIGGNDNQRHPHLRKGALAEVAFEMLTNFFTANQSLQRWQAEIEQRTKGLAVFDLTRTLLKLRAIESRGPQRPEISSHAAASHTRDGNTFLLQHLNHSRMRQATRPATGKHQTDARYDAATRTVLGAMFGTVHP